MRIIGIIYNYIFLGQFYLSWLIFVLFCPSVKEQLEIQVQKFLHSCHGTDKHYLTTPVHFPSYFSSAFYNELQYNISIMIMGRSS